MAIASKKRRKIVVGGENYLWGWLKVASNDRHFMVQYELGQPGGEEYLVVIGKRFAGAKTGGCWKRFRCPRFEGDGVTPAHVRKLIEWSLDGALVRVETGCGEGRTI